MIGKTFARLTVLNRCSEVKHGNIVYECQCICGNIAKVKGTFLRTGKTKSCGCLHKETLRYQSKLRIKSETGLKSLFISYKIQAKKRNIFFDIDFNLFKELTSDNCYYCGAEPAQIWIIHASSKESQEKTKYIYNGLDRVDNLRGYFCDNVRTCCKYCNYAKNDLTETKFLELVSRIYKKHGEQCK